MPPNTVKVDRSTRWGNPYTPDESGSMRPSKRLAITAASFGSRPASPSKPSLTL